jgi:hypothetical protein
MLTPDRCIGVLAVEVPTGREANAVTQAVTALIAAQLAAVLAAWPDASSAAVDVPFENTATAAG